MEPVSCLVFLSFTDLSDTEADAATDWLCDQCNQPVAESTRLDEDLESTIYDQLLVSYLLILLFLLSYPI